MLAADVEVIRGSFRLSAALRAPAPGVTALFGRSGCGKSTLVAALTGLLPGVRGRITLGEQVWLDTARGVCVAPEARRIGCVFQAPRLFPHLSVQGNLDYAARRARHREAFVSAAEVDELLALGPLLGRRVGGLSGGERSRVALGRALLSQPRLLILDEPMASLDAARRAEILPYLERLRNRCALPIVYVSHQYEEVLRLADHVVLLDRGEVQASGSPALLSREPGLANIVGGELDGAVVEGAVIAADAELATVRVGAGVLRLPAGELRVGGHARVLVPARDVLLATEAPVGLSVRNQLPGIISGLRADSPGAWRVEVDVGGTTVLARLTAHAVRELALAKGLKVIVLVKAEALRGHAYPGGTR